MKNILVSIDFNNNEKLLMDKALELAKVLNAKLWLLHVASPEPDFVGFGVGPQYIRDDRANKLRKEHRLMGTYTDTLKLKGVEAEGLLINGVTTDMILEEAEKLDIDLIITGRHEHSIMYKMFFGSVSKGIINKSNIPVMVVPLDN